VQVTVAATTLLGLDNHPGELAGYGPITAQTARHLAADATWRRILTDPISGTVLDVGRTTYRPPQALADHVRIRDRTCRFPGCRHPHGAATSTTTRLTRKDPPAPIISAASAVITTE
jgi:hypothetical protein